MISYTIKAGDITSAELRYYQLACRCIDAVVEPEGSIYTCHELARAVGMALELPVQDGYYENVQHSWLWTHSLPKLPNRDGSLWPNIIDVYVPGGHPQVQIANFRVSVLPARRSYIWTVPFVPDYDSDVVMRLYYQFRPLLV